MPIRSHRLIFLLVIAIRQQRFIGCHFQNIAMDEFSEIAVKRFYKATTQIAVLPSLSNVSDIEDSCESDDVVVLPESDFQPEILPPGLEEIDEILNETNRSDSDDGDDYCNEENLATKPRTKKKQKPKPVYKWSKTDLLSHDFLQKEIEDELPEIRLPLEYFINFFPFECIQHIVEQTNLYSTQITGKCIDTNTNEITDFLSIFLLIGIISAPSYYDYWAANSRVPQIADITPLKQFKIHSVQ